MATAASEADLLRKMSLFTRRASSTGVSKDSSKGAPKVKATRTRASAEGTGTGSSTGKDAGAGAPGKVVEGVRKVRGKASSGGGNAREGLLATILERRGAMSQKELTVVSGTKPSAMSEALAKLEADGYVVREVDPADHRASLVRLTERGAERAVEVNRERTAMLERVMGCLTDDERTQLDRILDKLLANLDAGAGERT